MRERAEAISGFRDASLELANRLKGEGRTLSKQFDLDARWKPAPGHEWDSAEDVLRTLLEKDPENRTAKRELERLDDPRYTKRALTPHFVADRKQTERLLQEAKDLHDIGKFDLAIKRADQVLDIDPYNKAARKEQQRNNEEIIRYGEEAYDEARSRAIRNVQKAWAAWV